MYLSVKEIDDALHARLFCNEDNYGEVLGYVNIRVDLERYVS